MLDRAGRLEPIHALTSLRFLPAIWVVAHHFGGSFGKGSWLERLLDRGGTGVSLFFVLSGFILAINYPVQRLRFRDFLSARFARIFPLYLLGILMVLPLYFHGGLYTMSFGESFLETAKQTILCLLLLQAWFPDRATLLNPAGWSLSAEAFFYLMFVPILHWRPSRAFLDRTLLAIPCLWILGIGTTLTWELAYPGIIPDPSLMGDDAWRANLISFHPLVRLPEFVLGVSLGRLHLRGWSLPRPGIAAILAILAILSLVLSCPKGWEIHLHNMLAAPLFGLLVLSLAQAKGVILDHLQAPRLVLLGEASYALYILHIPIHDWTRYFCGKLGVAVSSPTVVSLYLLVSVVASILAFRHVEAPSRKFIRAILARPGRSAG